MVLSKDERLEFAKAVKPLMDYLNNPKKFYPHMKVIVDSHRAELMESVCSDMRITTQPMENMGLFGDREHGIGGDGF